MDDMQEMLEHYRITRLVAEYCHGCDRGDALRMGSVYAEKSWDDHGKSKMSGQDFAAAVAAERSGRNDVMSHHLGQSLVRISGDRAGAETYFIATVKVPGKDGKPFLHQLGGRYVDELVRIDGTWKIEKRLTVRDWSITQEVARDFMGTLEFIEGRANGTDPSFAVLGLVHSGQA